MVEVKQGSADELIAYLQQHRDKRNLILLILDAEPAVEATGSEPVQEKRIVRSLEDIEYEGGIPTLPKRGLQQPVTLELVKQLLEEDD